MVFGKEIKVLKEKNMLKEQGIYGCYVPDKLVIILDSDLTPIQLYSTLTHELGHALFHRAGLGQSKLGRELEEIIVEQFSIMFTENFKL